MISAEFVLDLDSLDNSNAFWYTKDVNDERQFNPTSRLVSMYLLLSDVCNIVFTNMPSEIKIPRNVVDSVC